MDGGKKVLILGAAGRVGQGLVRALLTHKIDLVAADFIDQARLTEIISRAMVDTRLSGVELTSQVTIVGGFDVLDQVRVTELLAKERPDIVVNYAIPFTWDAAKQLPNYDKISRAGLGAFAAAQVLAPKIIAQALTASQIDAKLIVGNLPDITIPILHGLNTQKALALPIAGAGNVGLIQAGLSHLIATERRITMDELAVSLVAHHVHWVAPREPGYRNDAPFLLQVIHQGSDITAELGDLRELMNNAIVSCYEAGAGFSSTTALLASKLVMSVLDQTGTSHSLHLPAPNGLPGGYPTTVVNGAISVDLPAQWQLSEATELMEQAHQRDGIEKIAADGSIHFDPQSVAILKDELGIELPLVVSPGDLDAVAKEQIRLAQMAINGALAAANS